MSGIIAHREAEIRAQFADSPPTIGILDQWKELSTKLCGRSIEVLLADRREFTSKKGIHVAGEINLAMPEVLQNELRLVVYMEHMSNVTDIVLTHEICHWILFLQGFLGIQFTEPQSSPFNSVQIMLNSMAHHPPLYVLQRSHGIEPQPEIDSRAQDNLDSIKKASERIAETVRIERALLFADDLLSCSPEIRKETLDTLSQKQTELFSVVQIVLGTAPYYNLLDKDKNHRFVRMVIRKLRLPSWVPVDNADSLRRLSQQVASSHSSPPSNKPRLPSV